MNFYPSSSFNFYIFMFLPFVSFLAGLLTVLAPCSFLLLPIIIGGSSTSRSRLRPIVIVLSLCASLFLFTVLFKASSLFVDINPLFLSYFSGILVVLLGLIALFPE